MMVHVTRWPYETDDPKKRQLGEPRPRLRVKFRNPMGQASFEILLHEVELGDEMVGGLDRVLLRESIEVWD